MKLFSDSELDELETSAKRAREDLHDAYAHNLNWLGFCNEEARARIMELESAVLCAKDYLHKTRVKHALSELEEVSTTEKMFFFGTNCERNTEGKI